MAKSRKMGGGFRLNTSRSGIGGSWGTKGFRVGAGPRCMRVTAKNPLTGRTVSMSSGGKSARRQAPPRLVPTAPVAAPRTVAAGPQLKSGGVAFLCWLVLGLVGGHRYYLGRPWTGLLQTLTLAGLGIWWLLDLLLLPGMVKAVNNERRLAWLRDNA